MLAVTARTKPATLMHRKCETQIGRQRCVILVRQEVGTSVAFGASKGLGEFTMNLFQNGWLNETSSRAGKPLGITRELVTAFQLRQVIDPPNIDLLDSPRSNITN